MTAKILDITKHPKFKRKPDRYSNPKQDAEVMKRFRSYREMQDHYEAIKQHEALKVWAATRPSPYEAYEI